MPPVHLTVISYPPRVDWLFEDVCLRAEETAGPLSRRFTRCGSPTSLTAAVGHAVDGLGCVQLLDVFGHGGPGYLRLGEEPFVDSRRTSTFENVLAVMPYLTSDATIRLLGCDTGLKNEGFALLRGLASDTGLRVFGTKRDLIRSDFDRGVLRPEVEQHALVPHTLLAPLFPKVLAIAS